MRSRTKVLSLTIAGILLASIIAAISLAVSNAKPFVTESSADPHDPRILVVHSHVKLEVISDGNKVVVPANIGIDPRLYNDHSLDKYSSSPQMAPIHTHSSDGLIHIESTVFRDYTVGQFMGIWGLEEFRSISMTVDGKRVDDYANHPIRDGQHIILNIAY